MQCQHFWPLAYLVKDTQSQSQAPLYFISVHQQCRAKDVTPLTTCWLSRNQYREGEYKMIPSVTRWNTITLTNGAKGPPVVSGQLHRVVVRKVTLWIPSLMSKSLFTFVQAEPR